MRGVALAATILVAGCGTHGSRQREGTIGATPVSVPLDIAGPVELEFQQFGRDLALAVNGEVHDSREAGPETILLGGGAVKSVEIRPVQGKQDSRWSLRVVRSGSIPHLEERRQAVAALRSAKQLFDQGKVPETIAALDRAAALAKSSGDGEAEGTAIAYRGAVAVAAGRYADALARLESAKPLLERAGSKWMLAECINNAGQACWRLGRFRDAERYFLQALEMLEALDNVRGAAAAISNLGIIYREAGEFSKALSFQDRALKLAVRAGDRAFEAQIHNNAAIALQGLGKDDEARTSFEKAKAIFEERNNRRSAARIALRVAEMGLDSGADPGPALGNARQLVSPKDTATRSLILTVEGRMAARQGRRADAIRLLEEALEAAGNVPSNRAIILHELGVAMGTAGDARLGQALALRRELGAREGIAETQYRLAINARTRSQLDSARQRIEEAIGGMEGVRLLVSGPGHRMSYLAARRRYYGFAVDLLSQMGRTPDAFEMAERSRARVLLDQLGDSAASVEVAAAPEKAEEKERISREIRVLSQRLQERPGEETRQRIAELSRAFELAESEMHASAGLAGLRPPVLSSAAMRKLLEPGTVLLQYFLAEPRSRLWVADRAGIREVPLPGQAELERRVAACAELWLAAESGGAEDCLAGLRALLVPVNLRATRIFAAPDGILYRLPFSALVPDEVNEVVTVPSLSAVEALGQRARGQQGRGAVILADPVYDGADPRLPHPDPSPAPPEFRRLGFSRREAMEISASMPEAKTLFDFDASREFVTSGGAASARILHIASHGVADERQPELSRLVLSRFGRDGKAREGSLYLADIARLRLRASLVTLSACSAGKGKRVEGEGPIHLARGFLNAGARATVVSLWDVDDEAAASLMRRFYEYMSAPPSRSPAAALLAAQRDLARGKRWRHPFHWAGWILTGDWR